MRFTQCSFRTPLLLITICWNSSMLLSVYVILKRTYKIINILQYDIFFKWNSRWVFAASTCCWLHVYRYTRWIIDVCCIQCVYAWGSFVLFRSCGRTTNGCKAKHYERTLVVGIHREYNNYYCYLYLHTYKGTHYNIVHCIVTVTSVSVMTYITREPCPTFNMSIYVSPVTTVNRAAPAWYIYTYIVVTV